MSGMGWQSATVRPMDVRQHAGATDGQRFWSACDSVRTMDSEDVTVVRTGLGGHESALRRLLREYFAEANERAFEWIGDADVDLSGFDVEEAVEDDLDRLATADLAAPVFIARREGSPVGSVQLKRLDATTAEVKRLYVAPPHRGEGIGRRLMTALIDEAKADDFETLRLGVGPYLDAARSLYRDLGFQRTPPYEQSGAPAALRDEWWFMRRSLDEG
jgi:ribosomal protein S18 acetylase RimI-like enzyme